MIALASRIASVEILSFAPQSHRGDQMFEALARVVRGTARWSAGRAYRGEADLLCLWGPGAPDRVEPMWRQLAAGGHVACFDLAYWDRQRKMRVSIDAPHPQAWVMRREWPTARLEADQIVTGDRWNPDGPVVIAGIGRKASVQYGASVQAWEATMIAEARRRGRTVWYRPKKAEMPTPSGVQRAPAGQIETVLTGASLVCTWHSNVAVDAIRMGIPVICQDGAAAAVCPSTWQDEHRPLEAARRERFLANLAWFQWAPTEAEGLWAWLQEILA
jgi:hypothetical protein